MDSRLTSISVPLAGRTYEILAGANWLDELLRQLERRVPASQSVVISDANVSRLVGPAFRRAAPDGGQSLSWLEVPPGEASKSPGQAERLWQQLVHLGLDRKARILALGGGVVGDLAGFVAATYARGIAYVQIPTSLLAQVDSSVGGKVAINLPSAKNIIGCFWQPALVAIDVGLLATLPEREYRSGLAEVVKYGLALDASLFEFLERNVSPILCRDLAVLVEVVTRSCQCKARIVAEDETDLSGRRAILNYGHTFGHAFESLTGYARLLHGEAVSMGMHCAAQLAQRLGRVDRSLVDRQARLLSHFGLPLQPPAIDPADVLNAMWHDKKMEFGRLRLVLPQQLGLAELVDDVPAAEIDHVLRGVHRAG